MTQVETNLEETDLRTELEERLRFETLLADLSARFVGLASEALDREIEDAQRRICQTVGLDRSTLVQSIGPAGARQIKHSWAIAGFKPNPLVPIGELFPWLWQRVRSRQSFHFTSVDELPTEAAADRETFRRLGPKSNVTFPLIVGSDVLGALAFGALKAERQWPEALVSRLRLAADMFASALARRRMDESLRESEQRFRTLVKHAGDGFELIDEEGRYLDVNAASLDQLGYTREEMLRLSVFEIAPLLTKEQFVRDKHSLHSSGSALRVEPVHRRKNGSTFPVELTISTIRLVGQICTITQVRDITERKQAELALAGSELRYRRLHESMREAFVSVDMASRIQEFNAVYQQLLGYSEAELRDLTYLDITPEPWHAFETGIVRDQVLTQGHSEVYLKEYRKKDGAVFPVELRTFLIRDDSGQPKLMWAIVRDITERKLAEEALAKSHTEIKRLKELLEAENVSLRQDLQLFQGAPKILGQSQSLQRVLARAGQVAPTDSSVLLLGETGTGKELVASAIHNHSARHDRTMIRVNCAAIPQTLIESELFGREKGAYTGALTKQIGRFEAAHQSTLFLDEIGELPPEVQVKLLRVLEEKQVERLGSSKPIPVDVRIIAATNRDLEKAVHEGIFRSDLYYRLNVFPITMPPLCDRREDIPLLVQAFVDEFAKAMGKKITAISQANLDALQRHSWPGNVRELRNVMERAVIMARGPKLTVELPGADSSGPLKPISMKDVERDRILHVLEQTGWRVQGKGGAAEILGLNRTTLQSRMARLGIRRPSR